MEAFEYKRLLSQISRLYYLDNLTQQQIAGKLSLSRQKVQRFLKRAREEGVVRISIQPVTGVFPELERKLEKKYGLREAVVTEVFSYEDQVRSSLEVGAAAAEYLVRIISPGDRIVISWGGGLKGVVSALAGMEAPAKTITVVQGLGGFGDPNNEVHGADLTRRLARYLGGKAVLLPSPGVAGSKEAKEKLLLDPYIAAALREGRGADVAVMAIGAPRRNSILVQEGKITSWGELQGLISRGAAGDINLRFFNEQGTAVKSDFDDRVIGLTLEEIKKIDCVIGIGGGAAKEAAIRGALKGNLIDVLVTDRISAEKLAEE